MSDHGRIIDIADTLAVCPACFCLVLPSDIAHHDNWHRLDLSVDQAANVHIENLIRRVFVLEGNPADAPGGPTAADVFVKALEVYTPEGVAIWVQARNRLLDDEAPVTLMERGELMRVFALLESMSSGAAT